MAVNQNTSVRWLENNWFKIVAAVVLIGALGHYPYAYYQMTRWVTSVIALYTAYRYYQSGQKVVPVIFVCVGILFNPIAPFYLTRGMWQIFDAIAALIFAASLFWRESPHMVHPTESTRL